MTLFSSEVEVPIRDIFIGPAATTLPPFYEHPLAYQPFHVSHCTAHGHHGLSGDVLVTGPSVPPVNPVALDHNGLQASVFAIGEEIGKRHRKIDHVALGDFRGGAHSAS